MPPEAYNHNYYSEKSDIWSLGIILYEMLTGTFPKMTSKSPEKYFKDLAVMKYPHISFNFKN